MVRDYEREAQKPSMPARTNIIQRKCSLCPKKRHLDVLSSSGRPLESEARNFFEPRFGHDFSGVRIHTGSKAAESARALDALAYTSGENIVLSDRSSQNKSAALKTLAHELVHVVQQRAAMPGGEFEVEDSSSPSEREARQVSHNLMTGLPFAVIHSSNGIQRDNGDEEERRRQPATPQPATPQLQQGNSGGS